MPRIYLYLFLAVLPLSAQTGVNDASHMYQEKPPVATPIEPPGDATLQPGVNAPPPGTPPVLPMMPDAPPVIPKFTEFHASPGTIREGITVGDTQKTMVTLSAPATKDIIFHIESSNPAMVFCPDVIVRKGHQTGIGSIQVKWLGVHHDSQVQIKAYSDDNPEIILLGRLYLHKKLK